MSPIRPIRGFALTVVLVGGAACEPALPTPPQYFEASYPPHEPRSDWGRVDPELRAAGIRLHVELDGAVATGGSLDEVDGALAQMANALDRLPATRGKPVVARAAQVLRESADRLANGALGDEEKRAVVKSALDWAVWAMLGLSGYEYSLEPGVAERVGDFRQRVDALRAPGVGIARLDVYDALMGGRDALDGFLRAIANGNVRLP